MMKSIIAFGLILCMSGCVLRSGGKTAGSFDGMSGEYAADARALAMRAAEELGKRYPPARTRLNLDRAPGAFGEALEQKLRADGFVLSPSGLGVGYRLDVLDSEGSPLLGYVQVAASDGQMFSLTREVFKGTEPPSAMLAEQPLETRPLPEPAPMPPPVEPIQKTDGRKVHPVRSKAVASVVAQRNGVPVDDFCRWNDVQPDTVLTKGRAVYLSGPPAAKPAPVPVATAQPAPGQTSPALTIPKAAVPPAVAPVSQAVAAPISPAPAIASAPASTSDPLPVEPIVVETLPPMTPLPQWTISKGRMLRNLMEEWTANAGYSLIWNASHDYIMQSSSSFSGDFIEAVKNFFGALQANGIVLRVTIYQGNNVMEVSEH